MNTYLRDIFISYSREDRAQVFPLVERINREVDTDCWIDLTGIESGSKFERKIMEAIDASKVVVFMLSDASLKSAWTEREVLYAEDEGKRIVPVLVNGERLRGWFKFHFGNVDYIDIRSAEQTTKLIVNLRTWLGEVEEAKHMTEESEEQRVKADKDIQKEEEGKQKPVHIDVDTDCDLFCFKTFNRHLKAGVDNVVYMSPGKYKLEFVSTQVPEVKSAMVYQLDPGISCDFIEVALKEKMEELEAKQRKAEEEAKRRAEEEARRKAEEEERKRLEALEKMILIRVQQDGKYGFADETGNVVIPCQWKWAENFFEGLAKVRDVNGKWGFIDKTGKVVIPCQWGWASSFSEGLANVQDAHGKWGYIDKVGTVTIPCQWKEALSFSKGLAQVQDANGKWWNIDKTGKVVGK